MEEAEAEESPESEVGMCLQSTAKNSPPRAFYAIFSERLGTWTQKFYEFIQPFNLRLEAKEKFDWLQYLRSYIVFSMTT